MLPEVGTYVIETDDLRLELEDTVAVSDRGSLSPEVTVGSQVTFALDGRTAYVRKADGHEYRLRVVKKLSRKKP